MKFRAFILAVAVTLNVAAAANAAPANNRPEGNWLGAWGFVPTPPPPGVMPAPPAGNDSEPPLSGPQSVMAKAPPPPAPLLLDNPGNVPVMVAPDGTPANVTVRQLVRVAVAGKRVRLRFSNEGGSEPLRLGTVHIGVAGPDGSMPLATDHPVTFDGHAGILIPAGAPVLSDPIVMNVDALQKLIISIYVPGKMPAGGHPLYQYVAGVPGDQNGIAQLPDQKIVHLTSLVSQVEVDPVSATSVVVTLGDSITEGAESTNNAFRGWPDRLAERLAAIHSKWSVVNAGIGGNRLLRYGTGPNALARLDRDVFGVPGLKTIILLEGINDIGRSFSAPPEPVTAAALEAADKQIIARAHAHGVRVIGATLTPYKGAGYFAPEGEAVREAYNQWIMTSGAFDGVVDFARAVADPQDPTTFGANYNLTDRLHPNDAGYQAMADAIDLSLVTGK
jgi:lysophospholipase L1-like esterase